MYKTEQMRRIAVKVSKWAKKNKIPLDLINPAFGPLINSTMKRNMYIKMKREGKK